MKTTGLKAFIAVLLLCGIGFAHAEETGQARGHISAPLTAAIPAPQREAITAAAARTLRYITLARTALHNNALDQARHNVQQARELLILIDAARPTARLKEHIWVAQQHMSYETSQDVVDDLTLIDAELLSLGDIMPVEKPREHLQNAQTLVVSNDTQAALRELELLKASLMFSDFDLPLAAGEQQILAAQDALARNQSAAADKNLTAAEESIQFITLGGSAALVSARVHLRHAEKSYTEKAYAATAADLARASEWLQRSGKSAGEKTREEARKLAAEIDAMKDRLSAEAGDQGHTLSGFLHRSLALVEREAEDLWLRYEKQQAANKTLRKLLDAKTHLFYAEHELTGGGDNESIKEDLESADRYLEDALEEAEPSVREGISKLRVEIHALEEGLDGDRQQAIVHYQTIMDDLFHLIHSN